MTRKINFILIYIAILCYTTQAQEVNNEHKIGLVLSGGGAKGFAHIGVLRVLEKEGIPIDFIVGTSIGSIIGGLYSIGYNTDQLEEFARSQDWQFLLSDDISREYVYMYEKNENDRYILSFLLTPQGPKLPSGLIQGQNIINLLCRLTEKYHQVDDFNDLPISFACIGADLESGEQVVMNSGFLPEAMSASMAIPTVFAPVDYQGKMLVDGGIVNNFPVDVVKNMGASVIIGVDISTGLLKREDLQEITDVVGQLTSFMDHKKNLENRKQCDLIIEPDISGFGTSSFNKTAVDTLVKRGEEAAEAQLDNLKNLLVEKKLKRRFEKRGYKNEVQTPVTNLMVRGIKESSVGFILEKINMQFPDSVSQERVTEGINRLYGTNAFNKAYYKIHPAPNNVFQVNVVEKKSDFLNTGFNFNTEDQASVLLNITLRNRLFSGSRFSLDAVLSSNPTIKASFQISSKNLPELGLDLMHRDFSMDVHAKSELLGTADVEYLRADLYAFGSFGINYFFGGGFRTEYYKFNPLLSAEAEQLEVGENENGFLGLYGKIRIDNLDNRYFPSRGYSLNGEIKFSADEFNNIFNSSKTTTLLASFKSAVQFSNGICFIPSFYTRLILDDIGEMFRKNYIGGVESVVHLDTHLPFVGVERTIVVKDKVIIGKAELRYKLSDNQYLSAIFNAATHYDLFESWKTNDFIFGGGIKYSYNSVIGPIDFLLSKSDHSDNVSLFVNIGKWL